MTQKSIPALLEYQSQKTPDADAILGLKSKPLKYRKLFELIVQTKDFLNALGIGRNDRVAIVLPNGPAMATSFLTVASCATSAPLNPGYTASEYEFFLEDLEVKGVIVEEGSDNPVIKVAEKINIPVIYLSKHPNNFSGDFILSCRSEPHHPSGVPGTAKTTDIALILHTSGTTSKPKMVPLTQKNLYKSAKNIHTTLRLTETDRCMNIMPLFHIHGLMAAVMASISAGGSVVCTPGFYSTEFFDWLHEFQPTYYTAVPTMHQAILNRVKNTNYNFTESSLRFIRSSSSSLAPNVMSDIEETFGVPMVEAYGMTEASHQIACNPLPPEIRKPGSVGMPAGPDVAIMDENHSNLLANNTIGEIVIRGENVTLGYLNNPEANAKSFPLGWFRTGDQGYLDSDGYVFITGRIKEIINRGGEKISPREVDEVILKYPGVRQVLTFSMPHPSLGEEVAAAIVLSDLSITDDEIIHFAAENLAAHKIPKKIIFLDEIPKGPTGKLQRIGLAKKLGLDQSFNVQQAENITYDLPKTETECLIAGVWKNVLRREDIGLNQAFRDLGGDSMLATLIHQELQQVFGVSISLIDLYQANTIKEQADLVDKIK